MNRRQKKKKDKGQGVNIIIGCKTYMKKEDYQELHKTIENQVKAGSVILLPAGVHVEAVIYTENGKNIKNKEKEESVLEIPVEYTDGTEGKVYIEAYTKGSFDNNKRINKINHPRILSGKERLKI